MTKPGDAGGIQSAGPTCPKLAHRRPRVGPKFERRVDTDTPLVIPNGPLTLPTRSSHKVVTTSCALDRPTQHCHNIVRTRRSGHGHGARDPVRTSLVFIFWAYLGPTMGKFWASRAGRLYPACISRLRHFQKRTCKIILLLRTDSPALPVKTVE